MKIGVIGLGKLGMCLAAVFAQNHDVYGVDINVMDPMNNEDKDIKSMNLERLHISTDFATLKGCEVIFDIVNTPSKEDGSFSNHIIYDSIRKVEPHLYKCKVFVIVSTVMPGSCEQFSSILPSGISVCYSPEFIRLGTVVRDLVHPDFVLIGQETDKAGAVVAGLYRELGNFPIYRMDLKSAEIAKMALNAYITTKISFANVLDEICNRIGGDAKKITEAIGADKRIGHAYFQPGGAYGGPCFPRDNRAFAVFAGDVLNYSALTDEINKRQAKRIGFFTKGKRYGTLDGGE